MSLASGGRGGGALICSYVKMLKYHHIVNSPHDASGHGLDVVQARNTHIGDL